jgi:hypothetical protein
MPCLVKRWVKYRRKTLPTVRYNIDIVEEKKEWFGETCLRKIVCSNKGQLPSINSSANCWFEARVAILFAMFLVARIERNRQGWMEPKTLYLMFSVACKGHPAI